MTYSHSMRRLLDCLYIHSPSRVRVIRKNEHRVVNGLLPVGVKIHFLDGLTLLRRSEKFAWLVQRLGGFKKVFDENIYRRTGESSLCWVFPPVGNAECAIQLIELIQDGTGFKIFNNPRVQLQVCTAGELSEVGAALLSIAFYLGTDHLQDLQLSDFENTFTRCKEKPVGRRMALYGYKGDFDPHYGWWGLFNEMISIQDRLPFKNERTDILPATSRRDIININFIASLLVHSEYGGFWRQVGQVFTEELLDLLQRHDLDHLVSAPWIRTDSRTTSNDYEFNNALQTLIDYAFAQAKEVPDTPWMRTEGTPNILIEMQALLTRTHLRMTDVLEENNLYR